MDSSFLTPKIFSKFEWDHPQRAIQQTDWHGRHSSTRRMPGAGTTSVNSCSPTTCSCSPGGLASSCSARQC